MENGRRVLLQVIGGLLMIGVLGIGLIVYGFQKK